MNHPTVIFTDRDGDTLSVVAREQEYDFGGNSIPDPVISITRGGKYPNTQSVVFNDDEAREIIRDLASALLGEQWGPVAFA